MSKEEAQIRKALNLFERYIVEVVRAASRSSDPLANENLKAVRKEVVALIISEMM